MYKYQSQIVTKQTLIQSHLVLVYLTKLMMIYLFLMVLTLLSTQQVQIKKDQETSQKLVETLRKKQDAAESRASSLQSEIDKQMAVSAAAEERAHHAESGAQTARDEEKAKVVSELKRLASLEEEVEGLRAARDRLQKQLGESDGKLRDAQDRVRSVGTTGVVWSARREAPKEDGLLGKIKSPFKKG